VSNSLAGGHAGEWPYRHDPRDQLQLSYAFQPPDPDRIARAYPPRDRCAWSLEIVRRHARVMEIDMGMHIAYTHGLVMLVEKE
jgi:hypothetical protein